MKKERYLKQLLDVIRVLRGGEPTVVKKHLLAYEISRNGEPSKMFKLFNSIRNSNISEYDKLKKKISPDSTNDSFNKLIRRTLDRVEESLIIDVNIRRSGAYSDLFRMKFFLRKQIMQGQILLGRGVIERTKIIFNNVIRYSKKYELYDELIDALHFKQMIAINSYGEKEVNKLVEQIFIYKKCRHLLDQAKQIYRSYESSFSGKANRGTVSSYDLQNAENLYSYYEKTQSASILSYYFLLKIEISKTIGNHQSKVESTRKLISLIKSSPVLFSINRIAYLQKELSDYEYKVLNFKVALDEIEKVFQWLSSKGSFYLDSCLIKAEVLILSGKYDEGISIINKTRELKVLRTYSFHKAILNYLNAICLFGLGNLKESLNILSEKNEIEKDKEGWNVWIRIMRILCSIELLRLNLIDYDVENFRKYLQRVSKQHEVRKRDQLILKILMELDKQNYDFEETTKQRSKELELLKSTDKATGWNPDSPEFIIFHDWFKAKRLKREYQPNFEWYRK